MKNKLITYGLLSLLFATIHPVTAMEIVESELSSPSSSNSNSPNNSQPNSPRTNKSLSSIHNNSPESDALSLSQEINRGRAEERMEKKQQIFTKYSAFREEQEKYNAHSFYIHSQEKLLRVTEEGKLEENHALDKQLAKSSFLGFLKATQDDISIQITHQYISDDKCELAEDEQFVVKANMTSEQFNIIQENLITCIILATDNIGNLYTIDNRKQLKDNTSRDADETSSEELSDHATNDSDVSKKSTSSTPKSAEIKEAGQTKNTPTITPNNDTPGNRSERIYTAIGGFALTAMVLAILYKYNKLPDMAKLWNSLYYRIPGIKVTQ